MYHSKASLPHFNFITCHSTVSSPYLYFIIRHSTVSSPYLLLHHLSLHCFITLPFTSSPVTPLVHHLTFTSSPVTPLFHHLTFYFITCHSTVSSPYLLLHHLSLHCFITYLYFTSCHSSVLSPYLYFITCHSTVSSPTFTSSPVTQRFHHLTIPTSSFTVSFNHLDFTSPPITPRFHHITFL